MDSKAYKIQLIPIFMSNMVQCIQFAKWYETGKDDVNCGSKVKPCIYIKSNWFACQFSLWSFCCKNVFVPVIIWGWCQKSLKSPLRGDQCFCGPNQLSRGKNHSFHWFDWVWVIMWFRLVVIFVYFCPHRLCWPLSTPPW